MSPFARKMVAGGVFIVVSFMFFIFFSVNRARGESRAARPVAQQFLKLSQSRDYQGAFALLNAERQSVLTPKLLAASWAKFEGEHGRITNFAEVRTGSIYGNRVSIFPRYVEVTYLVQGQKSTTGAVMLQLVPDGPKWTISRLSIQP